MPKIRFTPIGHKLRLDWRIYQQQLHLAVDTETRNQLKRWQSFTAGWEERPTWKREAANLVGNDLVGVVSALHEILSHINYGTSGWAKAVTTPRRFRQSRRATRPGSLRSGRRTTYGTWRSIGVGRIQIHPGTPAGKQDEAMVREREDPFLKTVIANLTKANNNAWIQR